MNFLENFEIAGGAIAIMTGTPAGGKLTRVAYARLLPGEQSVIPLNRDVYFGPAPRKIGEGNEKKDVLGTRALWVDVDDVDQVPPSTFPPSAVVMSGHGVHLYWWLHGPLFDIDQIEEANKVLASDVPGGDAACWNANRFLRLPDTVNNKEAIPVNVTLKFARAVHYKPEDFKVLARLSRQTRHKIRTGDRRGYKSRSDRDWAIVTELIAAGASDELIRLLFSIQPCGDKHREGAATYLDHTITRARSSTRAPQQPTDDSAGFTGGSGFEEQEDGYYLPSRGGLRRVSTFIIDPQLLLDGSLEHAEDAIVGNVRAAGFEWSGVTFSRGAFTSNNRFDRETPYAAWQWLGRDEDIRKLLPHLMEKLTDKGMPRVAATPTIGLHKIKGEWYFVGSKQTLSKDDVWEGFEGPVAWLPSKREHPEMDLRTGLTDEDRKFVARLLPLLNEEDVIWPMIGWYSASLLKPWLEERHYRFPILSATGTKGSGKTTLIQRVFMPLFGQLEPKSYDSGTTRFVVLSVMGSTNATPMAFSEFRYDFATNFLRYILLAYDTGHDPRGRADQTTVDYPLSSPFSVDGEDLVSDPAARERILVAKLRAETNAEKKGAYHAYREYRGRQISGFAGSYVQSVLGGIHNGDVQRELDNARNCVLEAYPQRLPDRVRNNLTVAYFGIRLFAGFVGHEYPEATVLGRSLEAVHDIRSGRSRTMVDDFVEDLANGATSPSTANAFKWAMKDGKFLFQMASAHAWWVGNRRRQGRNVLERDAITTQLKEAPYYSSQQTVDNVLMYGVNLKEAQDIGLDIPSVINQGRVTFNLG